MNLFPALPGLMWDVMKVPHFKTKTQTSVSGRQLRLSYQPLPIWEWTLKYEFLRDPWDVRFRAGHGLGVGHDELRTLQGFFLQQQAGLSPFLFNDVSDNLVTAQKIGVGNGTTTQFQLIRTLGVQLGGTLLNEPIIAPNQLTAVYLNGVLQEDLSYTLNFSGGILTFNTAPANNVVISADFSYYFVVHFSDDSLDFSNFMYQLWELKQVKLQSLLI